VKALADVLLKRPRERTPRRRERRKRAKRKTRRKKRDSQARLDPVRQDRTAKPPALQPLAIPPTSSEEGWARFKECANAYHAEGERRRAHQAASSGGSPSSSSAGSAVKVPLADLKHFGRPPPVPSMAERLLRPMERSQKIRVAKPPREEWPPRRDTFIHFLAHKRPRHKRRPHQDSRHSQMPNKRPKPISVRRSEKYRSEKYRRNHYDRSSRTFEYITTVKRLDENLKSGFMSNSEYFGLDCKGTKLPGALTYLAIASKRSCLCVDIEAILEETGKRNELPKSLVAFLESKEIKKVTHDSRNDSEALFQQFGVELNNVFDTTVANMFDRRRRNLDLFLFASIETGAREMRRDGNLPIYTLEERGSGKTCVFDVNVAKRRMQLIWETEGRPKVWGSSPLAPYHQKYAVLNALLTLDLCNFYRQVWAEGVRPDERRRFATTFKSVCLHFLLSRERTTARSSCIDEPLRQRINWDEEAMNEIPENERASQFWNWPGFSPTPKPPRRYQRQQQQQGSTKASRQQQQRQEPSSPPQPVPPRPAGSPVINKLGVVPVGLPPAPLPFPQLPLLLPPRLTLPGVQLTLPLLPLPQPAPNGKLAPLPPFAHFLQPFTLPVAPLPGVEPLRVSLNGRPNIILQLPPNGHFPFPLIPPNLLLNHGKLPHASFPSSFPVQSPIPLPLVTPPIATT